MSIARHHNEWLSLVPNSGPFLSLPVLTQAFPQGLDTHDVEHARRLRMAFDEWDDDQLSKRPDPAIHRAWLKLVLAETLGYDELLAEGQAIPQTLKSEIAEYGVTLRPDFVVNDPATSTARLLVQVYPRSQSLSRPVVGSRWNTSPDTRMMQLLHDTGIRLGIVTNGDHWMLVNAPKNETTGYVSWYANLWLEEPITLRAFRTLLCADRLFSVPDNETLEALLDRSASDQQEVTDQLGYQVRKAVEVLIQAIDKADQEYGRRLLGDVDEKVLYESALTVMMRLVFLFCAEERGLLLLGDDLYDKNYAVSTLREQLEAAVSEHSEDILGLRYDAWTRLLTTFRAVHAGAKHDQLKLPAYGGSLFDPDRFPFLEGRRSSTSWRDTPAAPLPVSNRTVLHLLEALQVLQVRLPGGGAAEARKLSFRELNIEQIGHVYEGLLDHTAKRATEPVLGLQGTRDKEPEIALSDLEKIAAKGEKELLKFLKDETGRSESALKKGLIAKIDDQLVTKFHTACEDFDLWKRVEPFAGLVRLDTNGYPVVITTGSVYVTGGTDRRSSGTHYTPRSLTEPIVQYTLEPLVYIGPAEGLPKDQWQLRSAHELLDLKICDMACGSGAFLVQACRYLADRLVEAWEEAQDSLAHRENADVDASSVVRITPFGEPSTGRVGEMLIPDDPDERQTYALRIAAQRCLYGVDKNPLAVEMAKLSLWLLTLAKDRPFEFLDHAIRSGDSLVGIHNLDQLRKFNLDGKGEDNRLFLQFLDQKIKEAVGLRRQITEMQANTVEDVEAQDRMLHEANEKIDRLKCAADMLIAAEFAPGSAADKRIARDNAAIKVAVHFHDSSLEEFKKVVGNAWRVPGSSPSPSTRHSPPTTQTPFHWPLEFPEVLVERGGFDAIMGNPPFLGGRRIRSTLGSGCLSWLTSSLFPSASANADLSAFFVLRATQLLGKSAAFGFIVTSAIAEGDTRQTCLERLDSAGVSLIRAESSKPWPGQASVTFSAIWGSVSRWNGACFLNGILVTRITPFLGEPAMGLGPPNRLLANSTKSYQGSILCGTGFILDDEEVTALLQKDARNHDVIMPYMTGADLNKTPDHSGTRWVINFFDWPLDRATAPAGYSGPVAAEYPDCLQVVIERVKPGRTRTKPSGEFQLRRPLPQKWWLYADKRPALYSRLSQLEWAMAVAMGATKYVAFGVFSGRRVCGHTSAVITSDSFSDFAALNSSIYECWARDYASYNLSLLRFTPSDCFDTFAFPPVSTVLDSIGQRYHHIRAAIMRKNNEGLTDTYNHFHDDTETNADIRSLRELHVEMDNAVVAAYGWSDLDLGHGFHETKQGIRYTISEQARREVLSRLLKLNHERYAEEVAQGLHEKKGRGKKKAKKRTEEDGPTLFD